MDSKGGRGHLCRQKNRTRFLLLGHSYKDPSHNGRRIIEESHEAHVVPYAHCIGKDCIFMHDNARVYAAGRVLVADSRERQRILKKRNEC